MLSDDITKGVGTGIDTIGRVVGSAIRGAVLFGLLAFGAYMLATSLPFLAVFTGLHFGLGLASGAALLANSICSGGVAALTTGAIGGAALLGVTSLIPGVADGFGTKQLLHYATSPVPSSGLTSERSPAPDLSTSLDDNTSAKDGHVAALAAERARAAGNTVGL